MCRSEKEIILPAEVQISTKSLPAPQPERTPDSSRTQNLTNLVKIQTSDDRAEVIRSNKNILKRNLRNSLRIPRTASIFNKEENLTAASLKDLGSDQNLAFKKANSENTHSVSGSFKLVISETQKIIEEVFDEKYELIKKIGQGAHSTVYKALCKVDNKFYALKKIKNVSFQNWKKMKNLFRMVKLLSHENIITYNEFHFDQDKRTAFIVMQYCELTDLRSEMCKRQIAGKSFSEGEILAIAKQVASVLKYLHAEGICHRDLKPENILYSNQSGEIKVIDMDVCGVKKKKNQSFDLWTNTGTLLYRAPETFGVGYTEKADIWSLGTIVYELISGKVPFQSEYEKDFLEKMRREQVELQTIKASKKIKSLLRRCLEKDPSQRISADNLMDQMDLAAKDDSSMKFMKHKNNKKYFQDSDSDKICLGNILKFSYY